MRKKRAITLLEMMIVILLIGLIGGVVSYNLKGTLDRGKAFAAREGAKKLEDILNLEIQQGTKKALDFARDKSDKRDLVKAALLNSGLVSEQQAKKLIVDSWNEFFIIKKVAGKDEVVVTSRKYEEYKQTHHTEDSDEPPVQTEE